MSDARLEVNISVANLSHVLSTRVVNVVSDAPTMLEQLPRFTGRAAFQVLQAMLMEKGLRSDSAMSGPLALKIIKQRVQMFKEDA